MHQRHVPEREIITCIGAVEVRCPRVRDRVGEGGEHIRFSSTIFPPLCAPIEEPRGADALLYLKGLSTSGSRRGWWRCSGAGCWRALSLTIGQSKEAVDGRTGWSRHDVQAKRYVYFSVDSVHVPSRLEEAAQ